MAKQLNVSLAFTADTSQAKAQLQSLQNQLNNILKTPTSKLNLTDDINEAIRATAELSTRLQQATNVNTGNLDFSKFNSSLKQSGQSLQSYGQQLQKLGPAGQQAFLTLAKSVASAEIPIKRTNALIKEFTTTLANTARWQLSSSALHGFMGAIQSAYGYAQDLNASLNDIRIVTGQSTEQMARFAQQANAAAKALSTSTTNYTNASLIYYQQGLNDQQVKERTDVTIKMANVSKQSAETVSEQLTAVWNNFYDGSKSLEYYADVMTALGAATASSADEIAGGLEKFAAIGETIGLSYEYAASALATITSNTRQSEEVVGTALKTIFARIQGLNLGETLEDGVDLNKYSAALQSVGISIFESNGELKKMDYILEEMAAKWQTLNNSQQAALAQTVAGVRQYNQLVALMDNWDKGDADSMKANLNTAYNSTGATQKQADIYAESWEAAQKRVKAAAEKIYGALLNDDFFIDMLDGFEKILTFVNDLIENLGGLKGVLLALGAIVTKVFSAQISQGLTNAAYNLKMSLPGGRKAAEKERQEFIEQAANTIPQQKEYATDTEKAQQASLKSELTLQAQYMQNLDKMSSIEAEANKKLIERTKILREQTVELTRQKELYDDQVSDAVMDLRTEIAASNDANDSTGYFVDYAEVIQHRIDLIKESATIQAKISNLTSETINSNLSFITSGTDKGKAALAQLRNDLDKAFQGLDDVPQEIKDIITQINQMGDSPDPEQLRQSIVELNEALEILNKKSTVDMKKGISPEAAKKVDALVESLKNQANATEQVKNATKESDQAQEEALKGINEAKGAQKLWSDVMVESANVAFNVASAISMVSSAIDQLNDPNVSGIQKLLTIITTMGMVLPTIISLVGTLKSLFSTETIVKIANAAATWQQVAAQKELNQAQNQGTESTKKSIKETAKDTLKKIKETPGNIKEKVSGTWNDAVWDKVNDEDKEKYKQKAWDALKDDKKNEYRQKAWDALSDEDKSKYTQQAWNKLGTKKQDYRIEAYKSMSEDEKKVLYDQLGWEKDKNGTLRYKSNKKGQLGKVVHNEENKAAKLITDAQAQSKMGNLAVNEVGDSAAAKQMGDAAAKKVAGGEAFKAMIPKLASAAIAAVGVAVIVGTVAMVVKQMKKAEEAVNKAKESAQQLSENYDNVKASYDSFMNAQSNYQSASDGLKELTKGTVEYQEALLQANDAAAELLNTNENLKYTIEDGQIVIDQTSLADAREAQIKQLEYAQAAKMAGQQELREAEANLSKRDLARVLRSDEDAKQQRRNGAWGALLGGIGTGLAAGGTAGLIAGSVTGPAALITGAIGAVVGAAIGGITGLVQATSTQGENEALDILTKKVEDDETLLAKIKAGEVSSEEFKAMGIEDEGLIASLTNNGEKVAELIGEMQANTAAINAQNDLVASQALSDNETVQNSEFRDQIIDIAGDAYGRTYDNIMENAEWKDTWGKEGINKAHGANQKAKDVFDEYLKYAGLEGQGYTLKTTTGTDKNRKFVYEDAEGKEKTITLEAMQAARAAYEASQTLDENATKLAETFQSLADSTEKADQALLSFLSSKNFEEATQSEFAEMQAAVGTIEKDANGNYTEESKTNVKNYLETELGETLDDKVAIRWGYESADAMIKAYADKMASADEAWKNIKIPDNFNKEIAGNMSLSTAKALENEIERINLGPKGAEAGEEYVNQLNSMLEGIKTEDQQEALKSLVNVDWSDWDAGEQAADVLKSFGKEVDTTSEEWQKFVTDMRNAHGAIPDFSKLQENLQNVSKILGKLDFGSTIDEADYQMLMDYNDEWERYFMLQADGSRKFIGDSEEMLKATRENISAQREDLEARKKLTETYTEENGEWDFSLDKLNKNAKAEADGMNRKELKKANYKTKEEAAHNKVADEVESLLEDETLREILGSSGYDDAAISTIIEEARAGNQERLTEMMNYLNNYMGQDFTVLESNLDEMMASTATTMEELNQLWYDGAIKSEEAYIKQAEALATQKIQAAETVAELQQAIAEAGGFANQEMIDEKLIEMGKEYENCSDEIKAFEKALLSNDQALIDEKRQILEVAIELGELAEQYGLDAEEIANYADRLADGNATTAKAKKAYGDMAIAAARLDRGVTNLNSNMEDYKKVIKTANKQSFEFSQTMDALKTDIADIFNVADGNMFSDTFAAGLLDSEEFKKALQGDVAALDSLRAAATIDIGDNIIKSLGEDADKVHCKLDEAGNEIAGSAYTASGAWDYVRSVLEGGFEIGDLNNEEFVTSLNDMISAAGMTKEQIQSMLGSMGVSAEIQTDYKEMETEVPTYDEVSVPNGYDYFEGKDSDGNVHDYWRPRIKKITIPGKPMKVKGWVPTYSIKTTSGDTTSGGEIDYSQTFSKASPPAISTSAVEAGNTGGGGGGGGATNTPSKGDKTHKSEVVERYKEVTDQISKLDREMQKLEATQSELWGKEALDNIQKQIDMIDAETDALIRQRDEAFAYMNTDASEVQSLAGSLGVSFTINDGYITDYEDVMTTIYNNLAAAEAKYNSYYEASLASGLSDEDKNKLAEDQAAYEESVLQPLRDQLALLEAALDRYDQSADKYRESQDSLDEYERKKRALQFEKWSQQLELKVGFEEDDIELLEHLINILGDNFYKMAEALAYMSGTLEQLQSGVVGGQMASYQDSLTTYSKEYQNLQDLKAKGLISDADYIAGLDKIKEGMMSDVASMAELDDAMVHYYGDTLEAAMDELSVYTDMIEHSSTVLDHYTNILNTLGKSTDYKKIGVILEGQAKIAKNQADVSAVWYEEMRTQAENAAAEYTAQKILFEQGLISEDVLKGYEQKWIDAQTAANEAQDQMLSDAAAWAEALRAIVENELADLGKTLENELTQGYGSFDNMMTAMERANSLQEDYLTVTNKIYETNKLMRTAQQEIDKSTNSVAKKRLKQFVEETSALQEKSKLSQYELDIQQAKYDLLLAEIALEEAQATKSTVRLQRDSEGNFGYVYTADENQIADAQQKLEDAQNALYNISLDGANEYTEKYVQTMQEMYDTMTELQTAWLNGEFETQAEYDQAMLDAQDYYYAKLQDYSNLYQIAITTDNRVIDEAWSKNFANMTYNTAQWQSSVVSYIGKVSQAFTTWESSIASIEKNVGKSLEEIETNVGNITTNSQNLADTTVNAVIPALQNEIGEVHNLTNEYLGLRQSILDVINEYNLMISTINGVPRSTWEAQNGGNNGSGKGSTGSGNETESGNGSEGGSGQGNGNQNNTNGGNGSIVGSQSETAGDLSWDRIMSAYNHIVNGDWGYGVEHRVEEGIKAGYSAEEVRAAQRYINLTFSKNCNPPGAGKSPTEAKKIMGFDTGGYTGEWGSYGKLAILHEKELILNQQQTADLLKTMEFVDKILQALDLQALSAQLGGVLSSPGFNLQEAQALEQQVHIEASFPGVSDRNEIEEAFNNLINRASQYANRK